jgi:serine/threonine protein kinase
MFRLQEEIGHGAFGSVYRAIDSNGCEVAVKVLPCETDQIRARLEVESKLHKELNHPNLVKYVNDFYREGSYYMVMELVKGRDLECHLKLRDSKRLEESEVLRIFGKVLEGVRYMHERGIIHRDIKPGNVFLGDDSRVLLGDFSTAQTLPKAGSIMTSSPVGTPCYIAPEVLNGEAYDCRADIYSLGCLLFEMCTLKKPTDSYYKIIRDHRVPIPSEYSTGLANLVSSMLSGNPNRRPTIRQIMQLPMIQRMHGNDLDFFILENSDEKVAEHTHGVHHNVDVLLNNLTDLKACLKAEIDSDAAKRRLKEVESSLLAIVGEKTFNGLKKHLQREFEDMFSADYVRDYEERHEDHVRVFREFVFLSERVK